MLNGGVIMNGTNPEQAIFAEEAGDFAVTTLARFRQSPLLVTLFYPN
jgi:pyridoxal biosynthesis lyase PdxS